MAVRAKIRLSTPVHPVNYYSYQKQVITLMAVRAKIRLSTPVHPVNYYSYQKQVITLTAVRAKIRLSTPVHPVNCHTSHTAGPKYINYIERVGQYQRIDNTCFQLTIGMKKADS